MIDVAQKPHKWEKIVLIQSRPGPDGREISSIQNAYECECDFQIRTKKAGKAIEAEGLLCPWYGNGLTCDQIEEIVERSGGGLSR